MTFMPAHKDSKTPAGQLVFSSSTSNTGLAVSETTLAHYILRKHDSFDRYPYLKHGSIAEPKLTFDDWVKKSAVYYHLDHRSGDWTLEKALKSCWNAAQENVPPQAPGTGA